MKQHLEFLDKDHFEYQYHRQLASGRLADYIDFCWETDFRSLLQENPEGFADVLFPNIGYTYIVNLGTPFTMELQKSSYEVKTDGFLPRHHFIVCHHATGNQLFGIKFKVCPILFEKPVNFSEYKEHIFPLAYLIEKPVVEKLRKANTFAERVKIVFNHYSALLDRYESSLKYILVVTGILKACDQKKDFDLSIETLSNKHGISKRSLQRYFLATTSFSSKPALQTLRMRQALKDLSENAADFDFTSYGYYDYSHFCKHLKQFVGAKYFVHFITAYKNRKSG